GFYLGINGGGWGRSQWDAVDTFDLSGGLIGGTIGYNWQFAGAVIGAEGDIDWSGSKGRRLCCAHPVARPATSGLPLRAGGWVMLSTASCLTGGLAFGDINATRPGFPGGSINNAGWTVGAGLEVGLVSNVSLKAEYLYVDLGAFNCGLNCALAPGGNVSFTTSIFRAGANVRF